MTTINLLPWRAQLRNRMAQLLMLACLLSGLCAIALNGLWYTYLQTQINAQNALNIRIEEQVRQANTLLAQKKTVADQQRILAQQLATLITLHNQRFRLVELLDQLPKALPSGVALNRITVQKTAVELSGEALANAQILKFIQVLKQEQHWQQVQLKEIVSPDNGANKIIFHLTLVME